MKRAAENYLTSLGGEETDDNGEPQRGFQKADEAVLQTRKIRALPGRARAAVVDTNTSTTTSSSTQPEPASVFGTFNKVATAAPIQSPQSTGLQASIFQPSSLSPISLKPQPSPFSSAPSSPPVSATASKATKTLASFMDNTSKASDSSLGASSASQNSHDKPMAIDEDSPEVHYYKCLRSLNVSLAAAISQTLQDDPFSDLTELFSRYKDFRSDVQKEYETSKPKAQPLATPSVSSTTTTSTTSAPPVAMPKPPPSFAPLVPPGNATSPSATSVFGSSSSNVPSLFGNSTPGGGFTPSFATSTSSSSSPFKLPSAPTTPAPEPAPTSSPQKGLMSQNSFTFKMDSSVNNSSTPTLNFGTTTESTTPGSTATATPQTTFPFGSSTAMSSSESSNSPFGLSKATVFGSSPSTTSSLTPSGFGGLKPSGSIGNSVGFGFGVSNPSNPFGIPSTSNADKKSEDGDTTDVTESGKGEAKSGTGGFQLGPVVQDFGNAGEEEEETVHSAVMRAYRLKKAEEAGAAAWIDLGTGMFKINKHKTSGNRRILLRNGTTGKILINFNLYSGLSPSLTSKSLALVGHDEGVPQTYNMRFQTVEAATETKGVIEREVTFVKSKGE